MNMAYLYCVGIYPMLRSLFAEQADKFGGIVGQKDDVAEYIY